MTRMTVIGAKLTNQANPELISLSDKEIDLACIFTSKTSSPSLNKTDFLCYQTKKSMIGKNKEDY